ncbi:MAG: hypothetical protein RIR70_1408 [Pseudomonadota bacterium]|jgi:gamma-glutamyl:cysteine ligase YbdK (ATP-grasp superfamily)
MAQLNAFEGFGLEFEYMIVDAQTLAVKPIADVFLEEISTRKMDGPLAWSNELALHVVELKNPQPIADFRLLHEALVKAIQDADRVLRSHGATLVGGAMHPSMNPKTDTRLWPHHQHEIYEAFHRVFDCFDHGWVNLQSVQLNLPFGNEEEFVRLHAALRLVCPLIPALAAASPVAGGTLTGFQDYRMQCYARHQARVKESIGMVIPDTVFSREDYERRVLIPMYQAIDALDESGVLREEWLNVRALAPRFSRSAIEIRVTDTQECPAADLAIAQAIVLATRWLYEHGKTDLVQQQAVPTHRLAEVLQAVTREGGDALILAQDYLKAVKLPASLSTAASVWKFILHRNGGVLDEDTRAVLDLILNEGTLGKRIVRALGGDVSPEKIAKVWRGLARCLAHDTLFLPESIEPKTVTH